MGGFLRVTHPSATLLAPEGTFSFDLHVLGLPPTFNLSHDQTLQLKKFFGFGGDKNHRRSQDKFASALSFTSAHTNGLFHCQ